MMLIEWINAKIYRPNLVVGIELAVHSDNQIECYCAALKRRRNSVQLMWMEKCAFEDLFKLRNEIINKPIALSIDGQGVMHKISKKLRGELSLQQIIPNGKSAEFEVTSWAYKNSVHSVIKFDLLLKCLNLFTENECKLIQFDIGPFNATLLKNQFSDTEILTSLRTIHFSNNEIHSIESDSSNAVFDFDSQQIERSYSAAIGNAVRALVKVNPLNTENSDVRILSFINNYKYARLFKLLGLCLFALLFLVILSEGLGLILADRVQLFQNQSARVSDQLILLNESKRELENKKEFALTAGLTSNLNNVYLLNELLLTVPNQIKFEEIRINPPKPSEKRSGLTYYSFNIIQILGNVSGEYEFDTWLRSLDKTESFQNYEIVDLKKGDGHFVFDMNIRTK